MEKRKALIYLFVFILIIIICHLLLLLPRRNHNLVRRELHKEEIRPILKNITGKELSTEKVENLRAVFFDYHGLETLYVSFKTGHKEYTHILDTFGGKYVKMEEFPQDRNNPFSWDISSFLIRDRFRKEVGVDIFEEELIKRIREDALVNANTGNYPKDALTGYYLEFNTSSELIFYRIYRILLFKDLGLVYIFAEKAPDKSRYWR